MLGIKITTLGRIYEGLKDAGRGIAFTSMFGASALGFSSYGHAAEPPAPAGQGPIDKSAEKAKSIEKLVEQAKSEKLAIADLGDLCLKASKDRDYIPILEAALNKEEYEGLPLIDALAYAYYSSSFTYTDEARKLVRNDRKKADELFGKALEDAVKSIGIVEGKYEKKEDIEGSDLSLLASAYTAKADALFELKRYKEAIDPFKMALSLYQRRLKLEKKYEGKEEDENGLSYSTSGLLHAKYYGELAPIERELRKLEKGSDKAKAKSKELLDGCYEMFKIVGASEEEIDKLKTREDVSERFKGMEDNVIKLLRYIWGLKERESK